MTRKVAAMDQISNASALAGEPSEVGLLTTESARAEPEETVAALVSRMRHVERLPGWIAVCRNGSLLGVLPVSRLLTAEPGARIETLAQVPAVTVVASANAEGVAWEAVRAGVEVVAVQDADGRFVGLVEAASFLPLLVREHELDMAQLGGFLRGAARARTASEERVLRRVVHRAPWLLLGLAGAVVAAQIVRAFEGELERTVALAFFLPGIVYMADAVGTQTETLVIRGLSVGVSIGRILRLELTTGLVVGALLSLALFPLALAVTGQTAVSAAVSLSLLASATSATVVAMSLPWLMERLGFDPVFGSGPLATVLQDLASIVLYFSIALALVS